MNPHKKITDPADIPSEMNEEQARHFWDSHEITEEYLSKVSIPGQNDYLSSRSSTKPISLRLGEDKIQRLKRLAHIKEKGYQTLLKEFVSERLYEEEVAHGLVAINELASSYTRRRRIPILRSDYAARSFQGNIGQRAKLAGEQNPRKASLPWALAMVGGHKSPIVSLSASETHPYSNLLVSEKEGPYKNRTLQDLL